MSFWSKRIKDTKTIAKELNVDEEKIKELTNGERQIEGKTMDKVLEVIEKDKINKPIRNLEILQWYRDTNLKLLRKKFGYRSISEVARILNMSPSTLCNFEKKVEVKSVGARLIQLYEFYSNDFNKKIKQEKEPNFENEEDKIIWDWYKNTNFIKLREKLNLGTQYDLAKMVNRNQTCISKFENHGYKSVTEAVKMFYDFYSNKDKTIDKKIKPTTNKKTLEIKNIQQESKNVINKDIEIFDFNKTKRNNNKTILDEVTNLLNKKEHEVYELLDQNEKLKLQISRYEKLIDRL